MKRLFIFLPGIIGFAIFIAACSAKNTGSQALQSDDSSYFSEKIDLRYIRGFTVSYHGSYAVVDVRNPFDTLNILQRYVLIDRNKKRPADLPEGQVVQVPVERTACFYGLNVSELGYIGEKETVTGVAEITYVKDSLIQAKRKQGKIVDLGEMAKLNVEKIIEANPEILIISPVAGMSLSKIKEAGVPLLYDCSYMENTPLARAEWLKFLALFYKKEAIANTIFDSVAARYNRVSSIAKQIKQRPTVFSEKRFGQVWYLPGGASYMARFFEDAGADYLWKDDKSIGSLSLNFESVLAKASNADFWILKTNTPFPYTYKHLENEYGLYRNFDAFKKRRIIHCDTGRTTYYEEGMFEPDIILMDLVSFFHPELLPDYKPKFFNRL